MQCPCTAGSLHRHPSTEASGKRLREGDRYEGTFNIQTQPYGCLITLALPCIGRVDSRLRYLDL